MAAGGSAAEQARVMRQSALDLDEKAAAARDEANRYAVAAEAERRIVEQLGRLAAEGYHLLADRRWPGSRRANVDCVLVGPSGVFIVDPKCWADVQLGARRITRRGVDVTSELASLADLVETTRTALCEVGLAPRSVGVIAVLAGYSDVTAVIGGVEIVGERALLKRVLSGGQRLDAAQVDLVLRACMDLFPVYDSSAQASRIPRQGAVVESRALEDAPGPVPAESSTSPLTANPEPANGDAGLLLSDQELQEAVLAGALNTPIEDWMAFLHPDQAKLVRRTASGPSRIRGAAGTGKSVVGLHRAEWLARTRSERVLVTSFVRTVPAVLKSLYESFADPATHSRVEFVTVDSVAKMLLERRGMYRPPRRDLAERQFERAWSKVGVYGPLRRSQQSMDYWREEVTDVIKGRALTSLEEYQGLRRVGRRYPLSSEQRAAVWELYEAYQGFLAEAGVVDFKDVLIRAEQAARRETVGSRYDTIIVDEVQDISCVGLRMLHALVGDAPDGLLLIGDGQQAIYPGGFTLAEAGIDVRGRSTVLRRNYRNTAEILRAAEEIVAGDVFSDLDDREELGARDTEILRRGAEPVRVVAPSRRELDQQLLRAIEQARSLPAVGLGDLAVLVPRTADVQAYLTLLRNHGVDAINLADYNGRPISRVKVGTYHRAKGLDFKHVFLPRWNPTRSSQDLGEADAPQRERLERDRRTLFVAMTRARDGLWLGSVGS